MSPSKPRPKPKTIDLTQKLTGAIELTGGPRSHLVTLMDAAMLGTTHQSGPTLDQS